MIANQSEVTGNANTHTEVSKCRMKHDEEEDLGTSQYLILRKAGKYSFGF